ncbi:MAG: hypothetical protein EA396_05780 [Anaerolineaceae bacterium]|nr:MAG: hypothetical protein EA396_05780 [Anaerolineaceae bacterium]
MQHSPGKSDAAPPVHDDPMTQTIIHHLLVGTNRLQRIPPIGVLIALLGLAALVGIAWGAMVAFALCAVTMLINWALLWILPRLERSYGPDRPSALALGVVLTLGGVVTGLLNAHPVILLAGCAALVGVVYYSTHVEPLRLGVTEQTLVIPEWRGDAPALRVLHIGDIHVERITDRERRLNALVRELTPDVIVFSGDFVNISYTDDARAHDDIRTLIGEWRARYGVYCVGGTYTVESPAHVRAFCAGLDNLRLLEDAWVSIATPAGNLHLLGMQTTHRMAVDRAKIRALWDERPPDDGMTLLLTHAPDVAPSAGELGFDLYVCGHTHGGQLRLPLVGAIFSGSHYGRRYVMGRYRVGKTTLYTSRGVGLEGLGAPRARLLCPPEIVLWHIKGGGAND